MIKYLQLPFQFDVPRMQEELRALSARNWQLHYQKKHYDGEWSALPLRSTGGKTDDVIIAPTNTVPYGDTAFLNSSPYFKEILDTFQCPLQAVRLLKLAAGAVVKEHHDADLSYEKGEIRIHIPVVTNDEVEFYLDRERILLKEGECWYMNFNLPHAIINKSGKDRVHLVIDAEVNDWVKELFEKPAPNKKEIAEPGYDPETKKRIIAQLRQLNTETGNRLADDMEGSQ